MAVAVKQDKPTPEAVLANYIAQAVSSPIPEAVAGRARCHLLDTLAAILSGRFLPAGEFAYGFVKTRSSNNGKATLLGEASKASAEDAAFANAMAAHADETDDSHVGGRFHPGCAVIPAALAVGEAYSDGVDSSRLLPAIALGYDIGVRAIKALGFTSPKTTIFSTHSIGALFAAAATGAAMIGLNRHQAEAMLSFTAQQASGLQYWNRDPHHVEKSFDFGGKAAKLGVFAAELAKANMTAPPLPLTGENGYIKGFAETAKPAELIDGLGRHFEITHANIKKWPVGSPIQAVLDAIEELFGGKPVPADAIDTIDIRLPSNRIHVVDDRPMPAVSCQHLVAVALCDGRVGFAASHDRARMQDKTIQAYRRKIKLHGDEALTHASPERQAIVTVTLTNGDKKHHHAKIVRGTADSPMTPAEVAAKAEDILAPLLADKGKGLIQLCFAHRFTLADLISQCNLNGKQK